jgi:hypothetical protein
MSALPGESWEQGGCRYRMGDRYRVDAQGNKSLVSASEPTRSTKTGPTPYDSFVSPTAPSASGSLRAGRYPGDIDNFHTRQSAQVIPQRDQYHGPLPPNSAPGTPAVLPQYMQQPDRDGYHRKDRKPHKDKKEKKEKESSRRQKKSCC